MDRRLHRLRWALLGAAAATLVVTTATALAGSGVGAVFNLGVANTADATTALSGSTAGAELRITNIAGTGVYGLHTLTTGPSAGVRGDSASSSVNAAGVYGVLTASTPGIDSAAVRGESKSTTINGAGVFGTAPHGYGVRGFTAAGIAGVKGETTNGNFGVWGVANASTAVLGQTKTGIAIMGTADAGGTAGQFTGNVKVSVGRFSTENIVTFPQGATTPSVAGANIFRVNNGSATTITDFTGGTTGQRITLVFGNANTTLSSGSQLHLHAATVTPDLDDVLELMDAGSGNWFETGFSANT